jgi:hypothetical protein
MKQENKSTETTLVKKLIEVAHGLGTIEKSKRNPHFGYNYIGEGQLMAILGPRLLERNVYFSTNVVSCEPHYGEGKAGVYVSVIVECTFHNGDNDEKLVVRGAGLGWDSGDKGVYKAITGAVKYVLMKNFFVTDEQDPEAGTERPPIVAKTQPAAAATDETRKSQGHRRGKNYEETTMDDNHKAASDFLELKTFLTEHQIPDGFLLRLLEEKKLIDGRTKTLSSVQPGILRRILDDKSKANLIKAWAAQQADEDSGSATAPTSRKYPSGEAAFDAENKAKPKQKDPLDQRRETKLRTPATNDIEPVDILAQEGFENWREVKVHWGKDKGKTLGSLTAKSLSWFIEQWIPKPYKGTWNEKDLLLDAALCLASEELSNE